MLGMPHLQSATPVCIFFASYVFHAEDDTFSVCGLKSKTVLSVGKGKKRTPGQRSILTQWQFTD